MSNPRPAKAPPPPPPTSQEAVANERMQKIERLRADIKQIVDGLYAFAATHPDLADETNAHKGIMKKQIAPYASNKYGKLGSELYTDEHEEKLEMIIAQHKEWQEAILTPLTPSIPPQTRTPDSDLAVIAQNTDKTMRYLKTWKERIAHMPGGEKEEAESNIKLFKKLCKTGEIPEDKRNLAIKVFDQTMHDKYGLLLHKISTNSKLQSTYEKADKCLKKWEGEIQRYETTTPARREVIKNLCHTLRLAVGTNDIDKIRQSLEQFKTTEMSQIEHKIPEMSAAAKKLDRTIQSKITKITAEMDKDKKEDTKKNRKPDKDKLALKTDKLEALKETSRYLQNELEREGLDNVLQLHFRYDRASGRSTTKTLVTLACQLKEKEARPTMAADANAKKSFSLSNLLPRFGKK